MLSIRPSTSRPGPTTTTARGSSSSPAASAGTRSRRRSRPSTRPRAASSSQHLLEHAPDLHGFGLAAHGHEPDPFAGPQVEPPELLAALGGRPGDRPVRDD